MTNMKRTLFSLLFIAPFLLGAQTPQWIWPDRSEANETVYFRKVIELPAGAVKSAKLQATCEACTSFEYGPLDSEQAVATRHPVCWSKASTARAPRSVMACD